MDELDTLTASMAIASVEAGPLHEFTCFQELPTESRLLIWKNALPGPRTITVTSIPSVLPGTGPIHVWKPTLADKTFIECDDGRLQPGSLGMLSACRESREIALKALKSSRIIFSQIGRPLYFNDQVDTLKLIDSMHFIGNTRYGPFRTDLSTMENLVVVCKYYDWTVFRHRGFDVEHKFHCFKRFHKLKELTLVGIPAEDVEALKASTGSVFDLDAVRDTLELTWEWFNGTNRSDPVVQVPGFVRPQVTVVNEDPLAHGSSVMLSHNSVTNPVYESWDLFDDLFNAGR